MTDENHLAEKRYKKTSKFLKIIALIILIFGVFIGLSFILKGVIDSKNGKKDNLENYKLKLEEERLNLENIKYELEEKGIVASKKYDSGEAYDLYVINEILDPSISYCTEQFSNNSITKKYCSIMKKISDINSVNFQYFLGGFIIIMSGLISLPLFVIAYRREILSYKIQQVMPIAKEGIEKLSPSIGIAAKEITKGIKEGLKDEDK